MVLLDRLTDDLPQHQSRAGEDDSDLWIQLTAQLQQLERSSAVEIQVLKRNLGAVDIAHLPGQVEDDVRVPDEGFHQRLIPIIAHTQRHLVDNLRYVGEIAVRVRNPGINYRYRRDLRDRR